MSTRDEPMPIFDLKDPATFEFEMPSPEQLVESLRGLANEGCTADGRCEWDAWKAAREVA